MISYLINYIPQLIGSFVVIGLLGYSYLFSKERYIEDGIPSSIFRKLKLNTKIPNSKEELESLFSSISKMGNYLNVFNKTPDETPVQEKPNFVANEFQNKRSKQINSSDSEKNVEQQRTISPTKYSKTSKGELECKRVMEYFLCSDINKIRPDFLKSKHTGKNLEIDCYCEKYNIGVEYNGKQHYENVYPGQTQLDFERGVRNDALKKKLCRDNDVFLIEVPYFIEIPHIEDYIARELIKEFMIRGTLNDFPKLRNYKIKSKDELDYLLKEYRNSNKRK